MFQIEELQFSKEHIWIKKIQSNEYYLGITDFAQDLLGDIVFIDIKINKKTVSGNALGFIESVKTSSDIISPADAEVIEINPSLKNSIEKVNEKPYGTWLCKITTSSNEITNLLSHEEYQALIKD
tara:strand:- start:30578 stop:30952 length:375 start_codon:yes stop_codon:yes gene_type:complete